MAARKWNKTQPPLAPIHTQLGKAIVEKTSIGGEIGHCPEMKSRFQPQNLRPAYGSATYQVRGPKKLAWPAGASVVSATEWE